SIAPAARRDLVPLLLSREPWAEQLIDRAAEGAVALTEFSAEDRQLALRHSSERARQQAAELFARDTGSRDALLARYAGVASAKGDPTRGAELFAGTCASCHALGSVGVDVGPSLATLRDKEVGYWVKNI